MGIEAVTFRFYKSTLHRHTVMFRGQRKGSRHCPLNSSSLIGMYSGSSSSSSKKTKKIFWAIFFIMALCQNFIKEIKKNYFGLIHSTYTVRDLMS